MPSLSRRTVLAAAATVGPAQVAADVAGATHTSTTTPTADQAAFSDDFEDGDLEANPPWTVYRPEGTFEAEIVERDAPDGGDHALAVRETMGSGTVGIVGWRTALTGWDAPWTLSGLFFTAAVPLDEAFQGHRVPLAYDPTTDGHALKAQLGFRDEDGGVHPFQFDGELIDSVERTHDPGWRQDTWYRYELTHDGDGRYEGRLWTADSGRPSKPDAVSVGRPPSDAPRVAAVLMNGGKREDFEIHHAFVNWRTDGDVERRTRTDAPPANQQPHTAAPADGPSPGRPDRDWFDGWYPVLAWLVGVPILGPLVLAILVAASDHDSGQATVDAGDET